MIQLDISQHKFHNLRITCHYFWNLVEIIPPFPPPDYGPAKTNQKNTQPYNTHLLQPFIHTTEKPIQTPTASNHSSTESHNRAHRNRSPLTDCGSQLSTIVEAKATSSYAIAPRTRTPHAFDSKKGEISPKKTHKITTVKIYTDAFQ